MKYHQRDIVEINFLFPDGQFKNHPALIVSNDELQEDEEFMYFCLISSSEINMKYAYPLADDMLNFKMAKNSFVKCQVIMGDIDRDVIRKLGVMKQPYFDEVIQKIKQSIF